MTFNIPNSKARFDTYWSASWPLKEPIRHLPDTVQPAHDVEQNLHSESYVRDGHPFVVPMAQVEIRLALLVPHGQKSIDVDIAVPQKPRIRAARLHVRDDDPIRIPFGNRRLDHVEQRRPMVETPCPA